MAERPPERVLVVEDDRAVTRVVSAALRSRGYAVHSVTTGEAALAAAEDEGPDVVVLDLGLPDIDGIEVCRRLRAWSTVPIIVVTAEGADGPRRGWGTGWSIRTHPTISHIHVPNGRRDRALTTPSARLAGGLAEA